MTEPRYKPRFRLEVEDEQGNRVVYKRTEDRMEAYRWVNETDAVRNVWIKDRAETGSGTYAFRRGYFGLSSPALDPYASEEYLKGVIQRLTDQALDRLDKRIDSLPPIG